MLKKEITVDQARPGMELAQAVLDSHGALLVGDGTYLTETLIEALRRHGVGQLLVMDPDCQLDENCDAMARQSVDMLFTRVDRDIRQCDDQTCLETMQRLRALAMERCARRLQGGYVAPESTISPEELRNLGKLHVRGERAPLELVRNEVELAAFPDIYFRIREVLEDKTADSEDMARVVGSDPSLTAKLLKLANSSFYGFPSTIDSLDRAVTIIGAQELSTLSLGIAAITVFNDIPPELTNMRAFWRHSVTCGIVAKSLARITNKGASERCFVAGLLHDLGRLVICKEMPYATVELLNYSRSNAVPLVEAEEVVLGFNHSQVGSLLLREWALPRPICTMLRYHHDPRMAPEAGESLVIQMADMLSHALYAGEDESLPMPSISMDGAASLGLKPDDIDSLASECDEELEEMLSALF